MCNSSSLTDTPIPIPINAISSDYIFPCACFNYCNEKQEGSKESRNLNDKAALAAKVAKKAAEKKAAEEAAVRVAAQRPVVVPKKKKEKKKDDTLDDLLNAGLAAGKKKNGKK